MIVSVRLAAVFALLMAVLPASGSAQPDRADSLLGVEARLRSLEAEITRLKAAVATPTAPLVVPPVVKPAGREATLTVGGLLQAQGEFLKRGDLRYSSSHDRFLLRRARLNANAGFLEDYEARVELELAGLISETSGLRAQLTDGYVGWNRFRGFAIRLGQFKTPYGAEQLLPDPRLNTVERSLTSDRLTLSRQIGVQLSGELVESRFSYAIGAFNGTGTNASLNDDDNFLYVARLTGTLAQGALANQRWTVGINGFTSEDAAAGGQPAEFRFDSTPGGTADNVFAGHRHGVGVDTQLRWGRVDLRAEYLRTRFDPDNSIPAERLVAAGASLELAVASDGRRWLGVIRVDAYQPDADDRPGRITSLMLGGSRLVKGDDLKIQLGFNQVLEKGDIPYDNRLILRLQAIY